MKHLFLILLSFVFVLPAFGNDQRLEELYSDLNSLEMARELLTETVSDIDSNREDVTLDSLVVISGVAIQYLRRIRGKRGDLLETAINWTIGINAATAVISAVSWRANIVEAKKLKVLVEKLERETRNEIAYYETYQSIQSSEANLELIDELNRQIEDALQVQTAARLTQFGGGVSSFVATFIVATAYARDGRSKLARTIRIFAALGGAATIGAGQIAFSIQKDKIIELSRKLSEEQEKIREDLVADIMLLENQALLLEEGAA